MTENGSRSTAGTRRQRPAAIHKPILLAMASLVLLITCGLSVTAYLVQRHTLVAGIDEKLRTAAIMAHAILPPDYHDRISGPASVSDAQFQAIVERNNQLCRTLGMEYLWSLMLIDGKIVFTTSTSPDKIAANHKHAKFFEVHSNPELYTATFARMTPTYQIIDDKWGRIRVALIPFRDVHGRPYLFGASVRLTDLDNQLNRIIAQCLAGSLGLFLLSTLLSVVLARSVARPIQREITEREQAEEALRRSEARYRALFENSLDGILLTLPTSEILAANPAACAMLGRTEAELCQLGRAVVIDETDPRFSGVPQERDRKGKVFLELTGLRKDGTKFPVELMSVILPGGASSFVILRDITERKRAEAALRESEERLRLALEAAGAGVWEWNIPNDTLLWTPENYEMYGIEPVGRPIEPADWECSLYPDDLELAYQVVRDTLERRQPKFRAEFRVRHPQHGLRWILGQGCLEFAPDGSPCCLVGINIDITERKQAEEALRAANEQLAEADRRKDEFLAMLAHELRNPLAPIRNAVQLLRQTDPDPTTLQRQHDTIDRQVTHMARLLDDLLDVSRITHGKIELKKQPLALASVMAQAVETAMPLIQARRHALEFTPPPATLCVEADLDRMAQALGNLLANAAKYTEAGGRIWLEGGAQDGEVFLNVRDTGLGIAPDVMPRIFDLFAQAERSLDRAQGGLGIGLTLARNLVEMHGGTLEARSEGLGRGSEFMIRLPACSGVGEPEAAPDAPAILREALGQRVLVVDDVADTAESMAELLQTWDHQTCTAYDGTSALEAARRFHPDVVLLDIGLPGMNGYEVARRLRAEFGPGLLLIALTGYGQERDREQALQTGFDHHLTKPVDLRTLDELLRGLD